jgi:putative addiction module antidote
MSIAMPLGGPAMYKLKLREIGTSVGVILPKEALAALKVEKGDVIFLTECREGFRVTPADPTIEEQVEMGRKFMKDYRDAFKALAE